MEHAMKSSRVGRHSIHSEEDWWRHGRCAARIRSRANDSQRGVDPRQMHEENKRRVKKFEMMRAEFFWRKESSCREDGEDEDKGPSRISRG